MNTKVCSNCNIEKSLNYFYIDINHKDGFKNKCKDCDKKRKKDYDEKNIKNYEFNKYNLTSKICGICKIEKQIDQFNIDKSAKNGFRTQCKDCDSQNKKQYAETNKKNYVPNKFNLIVKKCGTCKVEKNIDNFGIHKSTKDGFQKRCNSCSNEHDKKRRESDPAYKLKNIVSVSVNKGLKARGSSKQGNSCFKALGYTPQELMDYLMNHPDKELWMTESNQGVYRTDLWDENDLSTWVWNIDHIIPQSTFNFISMDDPEFKECWSLKNLRPLSAKQNLLDGNRR